jgi:hypothetical protein
MKPDKQETKANEKANHERSNITSGGSSSRHTRRNSCCRVSKGTNRDRAKTVGAPIRRRGDQG